jgi:hypothetical protein
METIKRWHWKYCDKGIIKGVFRWIRIKIDNFKIWLVYKVIIRQPMIIGVKFKGNLSLQCMKNVDEILIANCFFG